MREQALRYFLIAVNFALIGMYFLPRETDDAGWLPPATREELQFAHVQREHLLAEAHSAAAPDSHTLDVPANVHHSESASATAHAYTSCDAPVGDGPADPRFEF